ncbi:MAG: siroheme synthase CysG [Rickettsiales bacterium]|nr:siroheme synthase CysG [Rickettsiales bacterium]
MDYFPAFMKLDDGRQVIIIGGGDIARAKAETLLAYGKTLRVYAEAISEPMRELLDAHDVYYEEKAYHVSQLDRAALIIAATDRREVNEQIYLDAQIKGILVNVVDQPELCDVIFPAIVRRGPLQIAISSAGISPVLARMVKQKIERVLPWNLATLIDYVKARRVKVKNALHGIQAKRLFWHEVVDGSIAEEVLEGNLSRADEQFDLLLEQDGEKKNRAALYLIGAGPGHPELITVKALRLLSKADVVLYDRLVAPEIIEQYARREAEKISVGKTKGCHSHSQDSIDGLIEQHLSDGNIVVRLKGGDPGIYAHGAEEIAIARKLDVPYQIVPGISAANGCAAYAGVPLTERGGAQSVRFLTLYKETMHDDAFWQSLHYAKHETLVFYMTTHHRKLLCERLIEAGLAPETPILAIEQGTTPYQRESQATLADFDARFANRRFMSPTLLIVGDVVRWREQHQWKEQAQDIYSFFPALSSGGPHAIH